MNNNHITAILVKSALLFFSVQVFFILLYFAMALMLKQMMNKVAAMVKTDLWLSVAAAFGIYAVIRLTDLVFLTPLHRVYMSMLGGSWFYYGLFYWLKVYWPVLAWRWWQKPLNAEWPKFTINTLLLIFSFIDIHTV